MKNNKLPKSWAVKNDGSQLFKDTVVKCLNNQGCFYSGDAIGDYYGISKKGEDFNSENPFSFEKIITLQEFISLTSEEAKPDRENEWDFREGDTIITREFRSNDHLITPEQRRRVLVRIGDVVIVSGIGYEHFNEVGYVEHVKEVFNSGYRVLPKEEEFPDVEVLELTKEQIAEKFGVDVSQIKIIE